MLLPSPSLSGGNTGVSPLRMTMKLSCSGRDDRDLVLSRERTSNGKSVNAEVAEGSRRSRRKATADPFGMTSKNECRLDGKPLPFPHPRSMVDNLSR